MTPMTTLMISNKMSSPRRYGNKKNVSSRASGKKVYPVLDTEQRIRAKTGKKIAGEEVVRGVAVAKG